MLTIKKFYQQNKTCIIIFIAILLYYSHHLISFRLGINYEEGRVANAYLWVLQGNLPYRDFESNYGPFSFLIYPLIMKVFGVSLIVLRLSYIIFASLVIPLAYFLARRIMPHFWAGIAAFLSAAFFKVPFYTYNHVFAVLGELGCLLMICRFMESDKRISHLFWAGTFAAVTILTKPILAGVSLFASISLFLLFFANPNPLKKRLKDYSMFAIATVPLILLYVLYFYSQTKLKNIAVTYPYFAPDSARLIVDVNKINFNIFHIFLKRLIGILPIQPIIHPGSFTDFKKHIIASYDNFIFLLFFIVCILIFFIYTASKSNKVKPEIKEMIYKDTKFLSLFVTFSIFISLEGLTTLHVVGRAFTNQAPFILTVYILYIMKKIYSHRPRISAALIVAFLFYLISIDFLHYPYSVIKRYRKYTAYLNLERAKGVIFTKEEKEFYEYLSSYLSFNFDKDDKMAVMGYYPQISFLTKRNDIFEKDVYIFEKIKFILETPNRKQRMKVMLGLLEDKIISKLEKENPKLILDIIDGSSGDFEFLHPKIKDYIEKNYSLDKVFDRIDAMAFGGDLCRVNLYKYKEKIY